jgi:hypothetical protein
MKSKNLIILVVVAGLLAGLAYRAKTRTRPDKATPSAMGQPVLAELQDPDVLNGIEKIEFVATGQTITVQRSGETWVAPDRFGYPVNFDKLRDFLRTLNKMKVGQVVPASDSSHERLELISPESGELANTGILVKLYDGAGQAVATFTAGKDYMRSSEGASPMGRGGSWPDGRYVAVGDDIWLVTDMLRDIPAQLNDWLDTSVANVSSHDLAEVTVANSNGTVTLTRPESGGDLTLADIPDDKEMEASKATSVANALSYLTFTDVADPALGDEAMGFDKALTVTARNQKGQVYTLVAGGSPEGASTRFIRFSASYEAEEDEGTGGPEDGKEEVPAEGEDAEAAAQKAAAEAARKAGEAASRKAEQQTLADDVDKLNARVKAWTYLVDGHKLDALNISRDDLLKDKEKEEDEEPSSAAPGATAGMPEDGKAEE